MTRPRDGFFICLAPAACQQLPHPFQRLRHSYNAEFDVMPVHHVRSRRCVVQNPMHHCLTDPDPLAHRRQPLRQVVPHEPRRTRAHGKAPQKPVAQDASVRGGQSLKQRFGERYNQRLSGHNEDKSLHFGTAPPC